MKKVCSHCPFRTDVKPFLHPSRGEELAYHAQNPINFFQCHKTYKTKRKECAGFITLQINISAIECPSDFAPSPNVYANIEDMIAAYNK
jgi:hypothetical protein